MAASIFYLEEEARLPDDDDHVLIECDASLHSEILEKAASGPLILRVRPEALEEAIADLERHGATTIYVRGARED